MEENDKVKIEVNANNDVSGENVNKISKARNKNLTIVLVVIIILLILAIGVCAGLWFASDTTKIINNKEEVVKEEENTSKKIDETKPWVYDAEFNKETKTIYETSDKSYSINSKECLKIPYININSEDVKKVNEEIEKLYEECYLGFGKLLDEQSDWKTYQRYDATYNFYENENILSVVLQLHDGVVVVNGGAGGGNSTIYTYNFNLETLKLATLDEMACICGFNSGSEVTNKITTWENNQYNFAKKYPDKVAATFEGVSKGKYFIDSNGKLNFVYKFNAASSGDTSQVIEPNTEIEDFYDFEDVKETLINTEIEKSNIQATPDEINQITQFLNKGENNGFVQQYYNVEDNARGLKMFNIIHAMQADVEEILIQEYTNEEVSELGLSTEQLHKISREKLDKYFKSKLGLGLLEIKDFDTTGFRYSEKYDAYYTSFGDSGHSEVTVLECSKDSTGKIWYVKGTVWEVQKFNLILLKTQDGWQFLSNSQD